MDKRTFLKFMVTTPAIVMADKLLALPGVEPKIQLLEEKKIVTLSDDVYEVSRGHIIGINRSGDHSLRKSPGAIEIAHGLYREEIAVEFYLNEGDHLGVFGRGIQKIKFDIYGIAHNLYMISAFDLLSQVDQDMMARVRAVRIHS